MQILQRNAKILREKAKEVSKLEFGSPKLKKIIAEMKEALNSQDDGVAIAAPQIGVSLRIFIVSKRVFEMTKKYQNITEDLVFINPIISKVSKDKKLMEEGCLSVRYLYGRVPRSIKTTIVAQDITGKQFSMGGSGLLAQIFQHETDHLDGVLFIDKAIELEEIPPEEKKTP